MRRLSRGSSASRRPSPIRFIDSTIAVRNMPGKKMIHGALPMTVTPSRDDVSPACGEGRRADSKIGEAGLGHHRSCEDEAGHHHHRGEGIGKHMYDEDARRRCSYRSRPLDELLIAQAQYLSPDQSSHPRCAGDGKHHYDVPDAAVQHGDDGQGEQQRRKRHDGVGHAHYGAVQSLL